HECAGGGVEALDKPRDLGRREAGVGSEAAHGSAAFRAAGFLTRLRVLLGAAAAARAAAMRASSSAAGSSLGSCGTNSPRNALARIAWSSWLSDNDDEAT